MQDGTHQLQERFLGIAVRISLYPVFLILVNTVVSSEFHFSLVV